MLNMNRLQEARVYRVRDKFTVPYDLKSPMKGSLITVLADDMEMTSKFLSTQYLKFKYYMRYYIEKKMYAQFAGQQVRKVNKQREVFNNGYAKEHPEARLMLTPEMVHDFNVIYEIGQFDEYLNANKRIEKKSVLSQANLKFENIFERLKDVHEDFPNHKKYLYIPVDYYIDNPKAPSLWTKRDVLYNFMMLFIRQIDTNPLKFKQELSDWTIIFFNKNEMFYLNCSNMDEDTPTLIRKLFRKFRSTKATADFSDCDDDGMTDDEDSNDAILNKRNEDKSEKIISDTLKSTDVLKVPDETKKAIEIAVKSEVKNAYEKTEIKTSVKPSIVKTSVAKTQLPEKKVEEPKPQVQKNKSLSSTLITKKEEPTDDVSSDSKDTPAVKDLDVNATEKRVKEVVKTELNKAIAPSKSVQRIAREAKIKEDMKNLKIDDNTSIEDLAKKAESKIIDDHNIKAEVINDKLKNIKFDNFEKGYNEKLLDYDTMNILTSFAEKDRPLYLIAFKKEDTSTAIDKVYTYTCTYEDEQGRRTTFSFDLPKFNNDKFMFLNGSDKVFINQIVPLPVTKVAPDQVQISSMYNKIFMTRFGKNVSNKVSKFFKLLPSIQPSLMSYEKGNNLMDNIEYMTSMEYDELSKKFSSIELKSSDIIVYFRQKDIRDICDSEGLEFDNETELPFAIETSNGKKNLVCLDIDSGEVKYDDEESSNMTPIDFIVKYLNDDSVSREFSSIQGTKKSIYTRAKIMAKDVPVILLISFLDGAESILRRLNCNYEFSETRKREDSSKRGTIQFKDGYLSYDLYPYSNSLLLNGFYDIPTEDYNFLDFSSKDIYYEIFTKMFGRRNIGTAFENFQQLFIDSITKEILEDYNLPTEFIDLIIYANTLLENNVFDKDGDLKNYRVRSNEMINAHLYKVLSKAYESYRSTADNRNPNKFSIKKNEVINNMFDSQVMEEYSNLNPIFEIDRLRATSYKGPGGCNVDKGFKIEKRAYNDSMLGIIAQSSPISSNVGISRVLSLNPNITSLRGYLDVGNGEDLDKLNEINLLSPAEMLVPMAATHDDPQRVGMTSTQSRHTIGTMDSDVPLFGYGMDKILSKVISDKFAFKAKEDGVIQEYNPELGYMIVRYESGKADMIDLTNKQELNTGSGFYINNKLDPIFSEVGKKFSAGDVLAANMQFFQYDELTGDTIYKSGPLARVAIIHGSFVYEDSTLITEAFANKLDSYVDETKEIRIGKNSNIYAIKSVGDKVSVNDPFIVFDESYEDDYLNKMLEKMNEKDKEALINSSRTAVKSKWNGEIVDIKIYYTCPKSEMSTTLRRVINNYESKIKTRRQNFEQAGVNIKDLTTLNDVDDITIPINGKIAGTKMDEFEILIKFFVKTVDKFSVGDKLTFSTALKGINQSLIPLGKEPYLASDPSIKIDAFLSLSGIFSRMCTSASTAMGINTVLIGAENKIKDILEDKDTE